MLQTIAVLAFDATAAEIPGQIVAQIGRRGAGISLG
jgi:hypothetical protein